MPNEERTAWNKINTLHKAVKELPFMGHDAGWIPGPLHVVFPLGKE